MIIGTQAFRPVPVELHYSDSCEAERFILLRPGAQATDLCSNDDSLVTRPRFRLTFPPRNAAK
jgi:hypothetical protein